MSQDNGDHEMADATAGAEANGSEGPEFTFEKPRLRTVRPTLAHVDSQGTTNIFTSYKARQTAQLPSHSNEKTTHWEMRCDI